MGSNFIVLLVNIQFSEQDLLKNYLLPAEYSWFACQISLDCIYVCLFLGCLFCRYVCLCVWQCPTVLITVAL